MRTWKLGFTCFLIVMMFLTGCETSGGSTPEGTQNAGASSGEAAGSGEKVLKVRFYDDPAGFDPANIFRIENENIAFNIFSGLTTYDSKTGAIIPDLAESWETSDNQTWKFQLRKGVKWQKGYGEFTSADVLYSYNRILDPATASPYAAEFNNVESFEAPDAHTFVVKLKKPDGNFLHQVANYHQGQIVKKEAVEEFGDKIRWNPVGTGPYAAEKIDPTSEIVLVRHEEYYKGPAPISKLVFSIMKDDATATIALQNGEIDLLMRTNREENLDTLEKAGFKMNRVDNYAVSLKVFNLEHPILSNPKVRQAWAHAVDFQAIAEGVTPNLQMGAANLMPEWMEGYSKNVPVYEYNPEKAKQLLQAAGYANGIKIKNLATSATGVTDQMQLEQEYLKAVGIELEFELVDTPTFNQKRNRGEFETATRLLPAVNPDMILFSFLHPDNISPKGLNGARYNNPEVTGKLEAVRAEIDPEKRKVLYEEIQKIAMTELPYLPTFGGNVFWPSKPNIDGVVINKLAQVNFYEVDIK
ncbi:ABC transporter substrate-binding protein [Paenibacillus naphthalenovorans]|uniref:ABC transporter substrate-binding protein n=1 Tax=Paenibacillus naphthalenovorans TaxID=162209 RepID=UPI0008918F40|nr:ABC transporter substrate-binding protein [Paenibacillus naphthalenovorans]SDJ31865.1 peptide/nickel transport system substrate-binding protein [Paenibacillus naphthalenovorans]